MAEKNNIPKIRFKGFDGEWKEKKLSKIIDVCSGRDYKHLKQGNIPVYGTGGYMLSVNEALSYDTNAIGIGRKGTIDKPYILKAPFWTVDTLFYCIPKENNHMDFVYDIFQNINWKQKNEATGVPSLSKVAINEIPIYSTIIEEQSQIGTYFQNLDKLITQHQKKYDKLVILKKAMLEKMFPKNGASVPEIRFKGFEDEWEEKYLGEYAKFRRGSFPQPYGNKEWYDGDGAKPFVQVVDVTKNLSLVDNTKQKISLLAQPKSVFVKEGTVVVTLQGSIGRVAILQYDAYVDRTLLIFEDYEYKTDSRFWAYVIQQKFHIEEKKAPGGTIKTITKEALSSFQVQIPKFEEQNKIGNYFNKLDQSIKLQQSQLDKLKTIKKACLEKMFV